MTVEIIVILERALFNNILPCCVPRAEHLLTLLFSCVDCLRTTWPATCSTFYRLTVLGLAVPLIPYCRAPCCVVLHMPFVLAWCRRCCKRQPAPLAWGSQINNNKKDACAYIIYSPQCSNGRMSFRSSLCLCPLCNGWGGTVSVGGAVVFFLSWLLSNMKGQPLHALSICFCRAHSSELCFLIARTTSWAQCSFSDFVQAFDVSLDLGTEQEIPHFLLRMVAHLDLPRTPAERNPLAQSQMPIFSCYWERAWPHHRTSKLHVGVF